ncbi:biotin-dependent carboxyltransferase [Vibrio sp. SCSIO 43133]|uniref:5-oxoprolinase subunit C family protein n=1 Tax=Vibrio sp. SCSIO 43133 TaxID=2802577 RepID=UPI0020762D59|nr:biotin-dependent carboxyltransferase family protein [Vibrio sp. SCSIO 43133]USE01235.1 biotin-dependent carboxyltransferase [Vibrio sp. SCSIO 43133]
MPKLVVLNQGHHATIQDLGRHHCGQFGLSPGGVSDLHAHCWGQKLLGNPPTNASIEILLGRIKLRAVGDIDAVLTGADCRAINATRGIALPQWQAFRLHDGEELHLSTPRQGLRTYFSVKGNFQIPSFLHSVATVERNQIGGLGEGKPLAMGDILTITDKAHTNPIKMPNSAIPRYASSYRLRLIPTFQYHQLSSQVTNEILTSQYRISANSNRMGIRLENENGSTSTALPAVGSMISEGIVCGAVQLPPDGMPIILLQDRQTLGGYKKLGTVAFRDLARLAQLRPGDHIKFHLTNLEVERHKQRAFYQYFEL